MCMYCRHVLHVPPLGTTCKWEYANTLYANFKWQKDCKLLAVLKYVNVQVKVIFSQKYITD